MRVELPEYILRLTLSMSFVMDSSWIGLWKVYRFFYLIYPELTNDNTPKEN